MNNNTSSAFDFDIFEDIRISKEKADREREEKKRQIMREKAKRNARNSNNTADFKIISH